MIRRPQITAIVRLVLKHGLILRTIALMSVLLTVSEIHCSASLSTDDNAVKVFKLTQICTENDEYGPIWIDRDTALMFVSNRLGSLFNNFEDRRSDDFWIVKPLANAKDTDAVSITITNLAAYNTKSDEGVGSYSNQHDVIAFVGCNRSGGYGSCDIWIRPFHSSIKEDVNHFGKAINTPFWESWPAFSDGLGTMFFVTNSPLNFSPSTVVRTWGNPLKENKYKYVRCSTYDKDMQNWLPSWPVTIEGTNHCNATSPLPLKDNVSMILALENFQGNDGFDFYITHLTNDRDPRGNQSFAKPVRLPESINSRGNEQGMCFDSAMNVAFFSSDRDGNFDIFYTTDLKFALKSSLLVKVLDDSIQTPIVADVEILNLFNGSRNSYSVGTSAGLRHVLSDADFVSSNDSSKILADEISLLVRVRVDNKLLEERFVKYRNPSLLRQQHSVLESFEEQYELFLL
jgi:hypothetical protein